MISKNITIVCFSMLLSLFKPWARAELYTAIADMEPLLETQRRIRDYLDEYITKEEERLAVLKNYLELYKIHHEQAMEDIPNYLGNPINAFTLIKRLTTDLDEIDNYIKHGTEFIKNVSMIHKDAKFPTREDLVGAVQALMRLQVTYNLDVHDLAEGRLGGVAYSYPMTAADCFELCKDLYFKKDYKNSLAWSMESLRRYKEERNKKHPFTEVDLLWYIACTHYWMEFIKNVSMIHKDAKFPTREDLVGAVQALMRLQVTYNLDVHDLAEGRLGGVAYSYPMTAADCFELCKDLYFKKDFKNSLAWSMESLRRYKEERNKKHPFTEVDLLWYIACTHYWMGDIKTALGWTKTLLKLEPNHPRAAAIVPHYEDAIALEEAENEKRRVSGVKTEDKKAMENKRFEALCRGETEINSDVAKRLFCRYMSETHPFLRLAPIKAEQVYIDPDVFVFHGVLSDDEIQTIKVLSTPLLSDVALGGATVFTELGLAVLPERGAALYWHNLHPSGERDTASRHAACPVLLGSKWVCTKLIHGAGQEFIEPCNLNFQREGMVRGIPSSKNEIVDDLFT